MKKVLIVGSNYSAVEEVRRHFINQMNVCISGYRVFSYKFMDYYFYDKKKIALCFFLNFLLIPRFLIRHWKEVDCVLLPGMLAAVPFLLWARLLPLGGSAKRIVLIRFFLHSLGENWGVKLILRYILANKNLTINVQSQQDEIYCRELTNWASIKYFPYCQDDVEFSEEFGKEQTYVFAGGYTNRDYVCMLKAAEKIPHDFIIICSRLNQMAFKIPANVRILKDIPRHEFNGYMKNARVIVIPLRKETGASGQMVALSAMSLKRPVIYSDVSSIAQYFTNGKTGIAYEPGNKKDLERKIAMLLNDADKTREIAENGYKAYRARYHNSKYYEFIQRLMLE